MKNITFMFVFLITSFYCFAQKIETVNIESKIYGGREIMIYTPRLYEEYPHKKYEVVYVFDSQARQYFDYVHSSLTFLNSAVPMIVVGVISKERDDDFLPTYIHDETAKMMRDNKGRANDFMKFLKNDLFIYVDKNYKTLPTRLAVGHSNGGVFITYCMVKDPTLFNGYIAISPHMRYDEMQMVDSLQKFDPGKVKRELFYYMAKGNESATDWEKSINRTREFFNSEKTNKVIHFEYEYFPSETHTTIYPKAVINGFNKWFAYQYNNLNRCKEYYTSLKERDNYTLSEEDLLGHISNHFWAKDYSTAKDFMEWGKSMFPNSRLLADFDKRLGMVQETKAPSIFPEKCLGTWEGTMKIYSYNTLRDSVKVRFTAAKTNVKGVYTWKTEYLSATTPMIKDYKLVIDDLDKGRYKLDEGDGVELIEYNVNNKLYSLFKVNDIWLTATTQLLDDKLIFEVTSGKESNEVKAITNYSFTNVQRVIMTKIE